MRIAFDGTTLRPRRTGVGYYSEHLLHHLAQQTTSDELVVISNQPIDTDEPLPAHVRTLPAGRRMARLVWMQTRAGRVLRDIGADVAHFTNGMVPIVSRTPSVVTIHDMSLRLYPRYHPMRRVLLNAPLMHLAARRASAIVTVSETAKEDIVKLYGVDAARVHVVYEAAAPAFRPVRDRARLDAVRRKYSLADRVILYVGTIEPRKNLPTLIEAFARARRIGGLDHQLVCVGPYGWLSNGIEDLIAKAQVADALTFTGYVPFDDLPALYSLAEMFVYPSMYEGFGLPVIEAMACGAPVITGRAAAVAEVGGQAVVQTERLDAETLAETLVTLARDADRRQRMSAAGVARAQAFSWTRAAGQTMDVYRQVVERSVAARVARPEPVEGRAARGSTSSPRAVGAVSAVDVLFGQAYFLRFDPKLWEARQPYAPLGALYAAACVREHGYRVALFDAMLAESVDEWIAHLDRHRPRYAVIYEDNFNYLTKMCLLRMREAALAMLDAARARDVVTIVAGSDATDHPAIYLDRGAAVVVAGEGEISLVEVLDTLQGKRRGSLDTVDGICLRGADGLLRRTPARAVVRDLDALPRPAWDLVEVDRYRDIWIARHGYFSMNVATTRGCPYHCNWCAKPIYGQRYTARSPEHVVSEIEWLTRTYRPDHLWIADDIFGLKPGWIARFAELVQARGAGVPFKCLLRADQVTADVATALAAAQCRTVWIGAESGSQRILDAMEKGIRVEQIARATEQLQRAGIDVGFFLQFGYPGETRDDIEKTLAMVRDCRPDDIGVSVSYPLPGTAFYERVKAQLGEQHNWVDSDDLAMMYQASYEPDFYRALYALVHAQFRAWKARRRHDTGALVYHAARLPLLRWRVERHARSAPPAGVPLFIPLSPGAAAVPTDQATLEQGTR